MLVVRATVAVAGRRATVLLDFFVEVPGRGADHARRARAGAGRRLVRRRGAAVQRRRRVGRRRTACPRGICTAARALRARCRWRELAAPAAALAREGVPLNAPAGLRRRDPRRDRHADARGARDLRAGGPRAARGRARLPARARRRDRAARRARARAPFYEGDVAAAVAALLGRAGRAADARPTSPPTRRSCARRCGRATAGARC